MIIFKKADELTAYLLNQKQNGRTVGFVPTMGALHDGHLSLIRTSRSETDLTVCSIFVNPTQFNNPDDFKHYPVTLEKDLSLLVREDCSVLFLPSPSEIYPPGYQAPAYDLGSLETLLEGEHRPGHFQGVCQVMDRLLAIVSPDHLYMGQKDFQQCMVVRRLLQLTGRTQIHFHVSATMRETDGLAMSSRNLRLDELQRKRAPLLFRELSRIKQEFQKHNLRTLEAQSRKILEEGGFVVDYVSIAKADDLQPAQKVEPGLVVLVAAFDGPVRLIDNLLLN